MNDGTLSQEEIDALLGGGASASGGEPTAAAPKKTLSGKMVSLREVIQGTVSDQQSLLQKNVSNDFSMKLVSAVSATSIPVKGEVVVITASLRGAISGSHSYLLPVADALRLLTPLMGMEDVEMGDAALTALQESFEQVAKTLAGALSFQFGTLHVEAVHAQRQEASQVALPDPEVGVISYSFDVGPSGAGTIYEVFSQDLINSITANQDPTSVGSSRAGMGMGMTSASSESPDATMQSIQFPQLQSSTDEVDQGNLGLLMDVSMEMTVELGRTRKLIREILGMGEGTIIELDKLAGEPVDILVNHKLIAKGEVVVIDENFGVRVTEIVSSFDRFRSSS